MSTLGWRKQFCVNGHDTFEVGRYTNGCCVSCVKNWSDRYYNSHLEIGRAKRHTYNVEHKKEKRVYVNKRRKEDINFKLGAILRNRLRHALKGNAKRGSAVRDLGCTIEFLKTYIESKFKPGMTWDNWGEVWELDHKKALMFFDLTDREQFLKACHYTNLQPLTIEDHRKKTAMELKIFYKKEEI